jgi:MFS family permease
MISAAATAGLVELDPDGDRRRAALLAGLAQAGGSAIGPLFAGVVAEWAPDPLRLPFVLALAATAVAAGVTLRMPEPARGEREPWRIEWPRVPPELRSDFARVSLTAAVVWAAVALYLSIVPSYARVSLDTENLALLAVVAAVALLASCAAQIAAQRFAGRRRRDQAFGLLLLTAGLGALIAGAPSHSLAVLLCGALAAGTGHGLAFLNAQQELNELAPSERRGEVTAAFVSCIYFLVATAVVGVGILDELFSLTASVAAVAAGLMALALAATAWQWRGPASQAPHLPGVLVRPLQ